MANMTALDFDGLDLTGKTRYGVGPDWYTFTAMWKDAGFGNPEQITSEQMSGLLDGSLAQHDRWGNRKPEFVVRVDAANSRGFAFGVADLQSRTGGQRRVLGFQPADGWGARTEYDVMTSVATKDAPMSMVKGKLCALVRLSLTCSPFSYSAREVTRTFSQTAPPEVSPVTVTIADGSSATGWENTYGWNPPPGYGPPSASGGWLAITLGTSLVYYDQYGAYFNTNTEFRYSPTIDTTATEFVSFTVDVSASAGTAGFGNSGYYTSSGTWVPGPGYGLGLFTSTPGSDGEVIRPYMWQYIGSTTARVTFKVPKSSALTIGLKVYAMATLSSLVGATAPSVTMKIKDVTRSNVSGQASATTTREGAYLLKAAGSAPGPMTLSVASPTTALGDVLLYSAPSLEGSGYQPDMQRWATSPRTVSATAISGYTYSGTMQVPLALLPEGTYAVVVGNAANDVTGRTVTFQTKSGGTNVGSSKAITGSGPVGRRAMIVGTIALPLVDVGRATNLTLEMVVTSGNSADEVWLYWLGDDAALSWFSSDGKKGVWVEQPVLGDPRSAVLVGDTYQGAYAPAVSKLYATDTHRIDPRGTVLHVACTGASDFTVTSTERPAWLDMAADLPADD